ncbi:MAG: HPP family protein [Gammaproteobacteria bacterium]
MFKFLTLPLTRLIGLNVNRTGHFEKLVSAVGGLCGMLAVAMLSQLLLGDSSAAAWVVASMGATTVLLFAVPHGPLSQPWPVFGGHLVAAAIGVTCAQHIPDQAFAGAVAVALTIAAMHYLRCIHPPGGATALTAIIGGDSIQGLGYSYLLTPVLLNCLIILGVAVVFNFAFPWRRYPAALARYFTAKAASRLSMTNAEAEGSEITRENLASALKSMDKTLDVSEDDLEKIYALALNKSQGASLRPADLGLGRCYSNGQHDTRWQVRQIVDMPVVESDDDLLIYKIVAGNGRRSAGTATRGSFARWARHEVFLNESSWQRVPTPPENIPKP